MIAIDEIKAPNSDLDAAFAKVVLRCKPSYSSYYHEWCCGCGDDDDHCIDSQCSMIANYSQDSRWFRNINWSDFGIEPSPMESALSFCVRALKHCGVTHINAVRGEFVT